MYNDDPDVNSLAFVFGTFLDDSRCLKKEVTSSTAAVLRVVVAAMVGRCR